MQSLAERSPADVNGLAPVVETGSALTSLRPCTPDDPPHALSVRASPTSSAPTPCAALWRHPARGICLSLSSDSGGRARLCGNPHSRGDSNANPTARSTRPQGSRMASATLPADARRVGSDTAHRGGQDGAARATCTGIGARPSRRSTSAGCPGMTAKSATALPRPLTATRERTAAAP